MEPQITLITLNIGGQIATFKLTGTSYQIKDGLISFSPDDGDSHLSFPQSFILQIENLSETVFKEREEKAKEAREAHEAKVQTSLDNATEELDKLIEA